MPTPPATPLAPFPIAGVDEVGRGPLAGPVVAAAVVLDPHRPVDGLDDSKRLEAPERERLDRAIRGRALAWCVASASVAEIDELNILHASLLAMQRAVAGLVGPETAWRPASDDGGPGAPEGRLRSSETDRAANADLLDPAEARPGGTGSLPGLVLVDGNRCPALSYPACAVVGGDARVRAIAAASIVAKVARDALMRRWHRHHPEFGFAAHKGYATKEHRTALARHGVSPLHRRSFAPVRAALAERGAARPVAARSRSAAATLPGPAAGGGGRDLSDNRPRSHEEQ